ncbi:hypothetical protein [Paenibacillus xylanivorans]
MDESAWLENQPYQSLHKNLKPVQLKAIPYYLWGNRQTGEMNVWLRT